MLAELEKSLPGMNYGTYVDPKAWALSASTTVADIKAATSTYFTADLKLTKSEDEEQAKKFRGRGFGKSLAVMKGWVAEADEMESTE